MRDETLAHWRTSIQEWLPDRWPAFLLAGLLMFDGRAAMSSRASDATPPRPAREFRGAWIATVANLDWPSKPGLPVADQKAELLAMIEKAAQLNLNVLIFQVRPACDALYKSDLEPWSEFLSGEMGKAPAPFYDPLAFAVEEAHRRGLELHAWFNPFRVRSSVFKGGMATNYILRAHPQFVRTYGTQLWMDPGLKAVQEYSTRVILDVVKRYDIDGVHLDDYFYPYPEKNGAGDALDFPDAASWRAYVTGGGKLNRADWRRRNVDDFVQQLYGRIKAERRSVKFGISPFGIWQLGFPEQVKRGLSAYDYLYADARRWLASGWVDYFVPQLYWSIDGEQSYPALLAWWASQNPKRRLLCGGNDATKAGNAWSRTEILKQVRLTQKQSGAVGNVFWNMSSLMRNNGGLADALAKGAYVQPALIPPVPWLNSSSPAKPKLELSRAPQPSKASTLSWTSPRPKEPWLWLYQTRRKGKWTTSIFPRDRRSCLVPASQSPNPPDLIALTAIDRFGAAGPTALLDLRRLPGTNTLTVPKALPSRNSGRTNSVPSPTGAAETSRKTNGQGPPTPRP